MEILLTELDSTIGNLEKKPPMRFIELDLLNEECIGSLMMFFFIETILRCYLVNVNPFDQPAVADMLLTKKIFTNLRKLIFYQMILSIKLSVKF